MVLEREGIIDVVEDVEEIVAETREKCCGSQGSPISKPTFESRAGASQFHTLTLQKSASMFVLRLNVRIMRTLPTGKKGVRSLDSALTIALSARVRTTRT